MNIVIRILKFVLPWKNQSQKIFRLYSKANWLYNKGWKNLSSFFTHKIYKRYNCVISARCILGKNVLFPHPMGIVIGGFVKIGDNVQIYQNVTLGRKHSEKEREVPIIGNNVKIYANSVVIGNVRIGNNAIIGCNSVVLRDVADNEVVAGIVK